MAIVELEKATRDALLTELRDFMGEELKTPWASLMESSSSTLC